MIRILYQVGNRRNSSPTLEVGVFLLEEDKTECNYDTEQCTTEIYDGCSGISGNDHFRSDIKYNHHCKNSSDDLGYQIQRCGGKRSCQIMILTDPLRFCKVIIGTHDCRYDQDNYENVA